MNEQNLPTISNGHPSINYEDPKMIRTLQATVAQGASPEEFVMFSEFCKSTGLNPFKKEIWFIKAGGRVQMMTGINGYLAIANRHPMYDGLETEYEYDKHGLVVAAIVKVYRKDRGRPSVGKALMTEFQQNTPIWKQKPHIMLAKVAKSIAIREAFPQETNGLYTEEEMSPKYQLREEEPIREFVKTMPKHDECMSYLGELPEDGEQNDGEFFQYSIPTNLSGTKAVKLQSLLEDYGATTEGEVIFSPIEIPQLEKYLISEPA